MHPFLNEAKIGQVKRGRAIWLALLCVSFALLALVYGLIFGLVNRGNDVLLMAIGSVLSFLLLGFAAYCLFAKVIPLNRLIRISSRYLHAPTEKLEGDIRLKERLAMRELTPCRVFEITVRHPMPIGDKRYEAYLPVYYEEEAPSSGVYYLHNGFLMGYGGKEAGHGQG